MALRGGNALLDLFNRLGCSRQEDHLSGDDFDWVWETSDVATVEFLDWCCKNLYKENVLTENEIRDWEELKRRSPDSILSGQRLQEALQVLKTDDVQNLTDPQDDETFHKKADMTREDLDFTQISLQEMRHVQNTTLGTKGKLNLSLGRLDERKDSVEKKLTQKQQKFIQVSEDFKTALEKLVKKIEDVDSILSGKQKLNNACFISECDMKPLLREDDKVLVGIHDFIQQRLVSNDGTKNYLTGRRDHQEFKNLVEEIERIKHSYADSEMSLICENAELAGLKAGCQELESQIHQLKQGKVSEDPHVLEASIDKSEQLIVDLQNKITVLCEETIPPIIDKKVAYICKDILVADLKSKISRQKKGIEEMNLLLSFLVDLISVQEMVGALFLIEVQGLNDLKVQMQNIGETQNSIEKNHLEKLEMFEAAKDRKMKNHRKTLKSEDLVSILANKIVGSNGLDSSVVTITDVLKSVKTLKSEVDNLESKICQTDLQVDLEKKKLKDSISKLQSEFHMDSNTGGVLTSPEVSGRIQQALTDVRHFETSIKDVVEAWHKARKSLKENPTMAAERAIWKDYFNRPDVLERNILALKSSSGAASSSLQ